MIDSHCHLELSQFDEDREEVIEKAKEKLQAVVNSCAKIPDSKKVLNLHRSNPDFVYPCMGLHPEWVLKASESEIENYRNFIREVSDEIVAVGEVGLDYFQVDEADRKRTKEIFQSFIELSNGLDLPLVVHSRNSMKDTLEILKSKDGKVVIHCFAGDMDDLEECLDRKYYLSFGGIVFRSEEKYSEILKDVPLENLLLETDAPFLGKSKGDRTEPWFIREVAERIADVKDEDFSDVWEKAAKNASKVFGIPKS